MTAMTVQFDMLPSIIVSAFETQTPCCYYKCFVLSFFLFLFHFSAEICIRFSFLQTSSIVQAYYWNLNTGAKMVSVVNYFIP